MNLTPNRMLAVGALALAVIGFGLTAFADYTLPGDETWSASDVTTKMTGTINLNGHKLTVPELKGTATITGAGELHVNVPSDAENVNSTVALTGALKFVKEGAGSFTAAKTGQTYTGGTEVAGGLLNLPADNTTATGCLGAASGAVRVGAGAILDFNGNTGFKAYSVVLAGGTLRDCPQYVTANSGTVGNVTLEANSTEIVFGHLDHTGLVDLNGYTLTLSIGSGRQYKMPTGGSFSNGTVNITSGGYIRTRNLTRDMRTVDLKINSATWLEYDVKVRNLEILYTPNYADGVGRFLIYGTYKAGNYHRNCELQDGATLDLSSQTVAWPVESTLSTSTPVTFAADATINVTLGNRTDVGVGDRIVSWQAANKPAATVTFLTVGETWEGMDLKVEDDGLYLSESYVAKAEWTGKGDPTNVNDPANWKCTNARDAKLDGKIPTADTVVTLTSACTNNFTATSCFTANTVILPATLGADNLDWSGITAPFSGTLDLKGKTLTLSQLSGAAVFTDSLQVDYVLLDSITAVFTDAPYIKTGVNVANNLEYVLDFGKYVCSGYSNRALCALDCSSAADAFFFCHQDRSTGNPWFLFQGASNDNRYLMALNQDHTYRLTVVANNIGTGNGSVTLADTTPGSTIAPVTRNYTGVTKVGSVVSNKELALFAKNNGGNYSAFTLYRFWVKDGEGVEHTFVPVRQVSTGKYGILDLEAYRADSATGFHGNARSGADFTPGVTTNFLFKAGTAGTLGTLRVNVAEGTTLTNSTVTFTGSLKLVKEGAGAFTAAKTGQTYFGGTEVAGGLLDLPADNTGAAGCLGAASSVVRVDAGTILDVNNNSEFKVYSLVLAGGMLRTGTVNTKAASGAVGRVTLEADSSESAANVIYHKGLIDLNGYTLTVSIGSGRRYQLTADGAFVNGTVNITSGGFLFYDVDYARDMRPVDLKVKAATRIKSDIKVRNLELSFTADTQDLESGHFLIYGTYKAGIYHRHCVLQDGATLDLSGQTDAWPVESTLATSTPVTFAPGATINVTLGGRNPKGGPIVTWQTENKPDDTVTFVLDPSVNARLIRKSDGLWLQTGLLIRIR